MSLMGTLAKVAIGIAVAKGVSSVVGRKAATGAGSGGTFGGQYSPGGSDGGLGDMMGEILGGKGAPSSSSSGGMDGGRGGGGLGDLLNELGQHAPAETASTTRGTPGGGGLDDLIGSLGAGRSGGSLGDLFGGMLGGAQGQSGGGIGDILGGILGGAAAGRGGAFGDLVNQSLGNRGEPDTQPTVEQNAVAGLMLRAMIQAAKADGKIDAEEQKKLLGNLGQVTAAEKRFVDAELRAPIDVEGLARQVPRGLEMQVYTMSLMAIDLDNRNEANYLHQLAAALGLDQRSVNGIHARLGAPALYG